MAPDRIEKATRIVGATGTASSIDGPAEMVTIGERSDQARDTAPAKAV